MDIDDRFVDVDFPDDPNFTFGDTGTPMFADYGPSYEELYGVLSDAEIRDAVKASDDAGGALDLLVVNIFNQGKEGSCVANAYAQAHQVVQAKQFGKDKVIRLSAMSLYKRIGRSASSGANIGDGYEEVDERGILPLDNAENKAKFKHTHPATGFSKPLPQGWEETAKLFAGHEGHHVKSVAGLKSAIVSGFPVVVGRDGHSIMYSRLMQKGGEDVFKYPNSWGDWGDEGYGYDTESKYRKSATSCWALRSVTVRKT